MERRGLLARAQLAPGLVIGAAFALLLLVSWPILLSFDLWVLKDRSSLLNLDVLIDAGLTPAVDTYYQYGLLPALLQRWLFAAFGRGWAPMLGATLVYAAASAALWAALLRRLPSGPAWLAAIVVSAPILLWVNPNFPYCIVLLAMLGALLLVLRGRSDLALASAAVGALSVPSLPLVLGALLVVLIVAEWAAGPKRSLQTLVLRFLPAMLVYGSGALLLAAVFGPRSLLNTALPLQGAAFYVTQNYSVMAFLHPPNVAENHYLYYVFNRPTWWLLATAVLTLTALASLLRMLRARRPEPLGAAVSVAAGVHLVFAFAAYGPPPQHIIYDPLLAAGALLGLATLPAGRLRGGLLAALILLAALGNASQARETVTAWRTTHRTPTSGALYMEDALAPEWAKVLALAGSSKVLIVSYATGIRHYYPTLAAPSLWTLNKGQLLPGDTRRLVEQIAAADIVVEELGGPITFVHEDPEIGPALRPLCVTEASPRLVIRRRAPAAGSALCPATPGPIVAGAG